MNRIVVRIVALASSVLFGFGVVWVLLMLSSDQGITPHSRLDNFEESLIEEESVDTKFTTTSETHETRDVPDQIIELVIPKDLFSQKHAISSWVVALDNDRTLAWLKQSTNDRWEVSSQFRFNFQKALVQKLSQSSPNRALEFALARNEPVRSSLGSVVLVQWATNNLNDAIERAKTVDELDRDWVLHSIFQSQTELSREQQKEIAREFGNESYAIPYLFHLFLASEHEDPRDYWYEIVEHTTQDNYRYVDVFTTVATAWIDQHGLQILNEITASVKDHYVSHLVAEGVIENFTDVEERSTEAFEYVLNLDDNFPRKFDVLNLIIDKWAKQNPKSVLQRTLTLPSSEYKERMVQTAYFEEAKNDPAGTLENLADAPLVHQAIVGEAAVRALSRTTPKDAADIVLRIADKELQRAVATALVQSWGQRDLKGVKDWVLNLSGDEPLRNSLLAPLADSIVETDPRLAFQIASQQLLYDRGGIMRGHEAEIVKQIAQKNVELAIELLSQVREEAKWIAYHAVVRHLINEGNSHRAILMGNELAVPEQKEYFSPMTVWNWVDTDAKGLKNNIEQVASGETRSYVAYLMISLNSQTRAYNTEEIQSLKQYLTEETKEALERQEKESTQ